MAKYPDLTTGQSEACINRMGGWDNFLRYIGGQGRIVFDSILTLIRSITISAQPALTTTEEYFREAGVYSMGDNFKTHFIGLEVGAVEAIELSVHKLEKSSLDAPILTELGDKAETTPSQFRQFLLENKKAKGWFIFYLRSKDGTLWAVNAVWIDGLGWGVGADSVTDPDGWGAGDQVVSRK